MHPLALHLPQSLQEHDKECAARLIESLIKAGHYVSVNDSEETTVSLSRDQVEVLKAMATTDHDYIIVHDRTPADTVLRRGTFMLVWGNGPGETIADHTANDFCELHYNTANEPWDDFVIAGPLDDEDVRLYWSNNHGWVKRDQATVFSWKEKHLRNPMGATGRERD